MRVPNGEYRISVEITPQDHDSEKLVPVEWQITHDEVLIAHGTDQSWLLAWASAGYWFGAYCDGLRGPMPLPATPAPILPPTRRILVEEIYQIRGRWTRERHIEWAILGAYGQEEESGRVDGVVFAENGYQAALARW